MKKTKIVATIGPASDSKEKLLEMFQGGVNVARINFSHGTHESNGRAMDLVKELREEIKRPIGIIADLQGPRMRVGNKEGFLIEKDEVIFVSDYEKKTDEKELVIDSDGVVESLKVGDRILVEDGLHRLEVIEKNGNLAKAKVLNGGEIKPRKNMNFPDTHLSFGAVTKKDEIDLVFAMEKEVDFVALSFVSNGQEIESTRDKMKEILGREHDLPQIISKVERAEAMKNIDEIIEASDVIMVARGDLGIEMEESMVVIYQKELIAKCLKAGRPVIVATQMLDSMINNPIPTRAEVSDVSNAVIDHTDAVMLSGESANGKYPVETVKIMSNIISNTEKSPYDDISRTRNSGIKSDYAIIIRGAYELARSFDAKAIVMTSVSGFTARLVSHFRPEQKIIVATNSEKTYNQLSIAWGVDTYNFKNESLDNLLEKVISEAKKDHKLEDGDKIVVVLGKLPNGDKMRLIGVREV